MTSLKSNLKSSLKRKALSAISTFLILILSLMSAYAHTNDQVDAHTNAQVANKEIYNNASPSVYTLYAVDEDKRKMSLGSAVAIDEHLLATNCHVALSGDYLIIEVNDKPHLGRIFYNKQAKDFCVVEVTGASLNPVQIRASKTVDIGEDVYAIGNPDGKLKAMSQGTISNKIMRDDMQVLQTNASISHGSSGGGLFDKNSNLIGITTSGDAFDESIRYAIPSELIIDVIKNKNLKKLEVDVAKRAVSI